MRINYVEELNNGRINIKPINFWQALGLSFLFDLALTSVNIPTDIFYSVLYEMGVEVTNYFWYSVSMVLSCIYQFGTILIIILFINKKINITNETENSFKLRMEDWILAPMLIISYILLTYGWFDYILFSLPVGEMIESAMDYLESLPMVLILIETCIMAPIFEELLYRGILLKGLMNKYNSKKAIVYSALIFGIAHLNLPQGINAFFLGLMIGLVFYYTKSIYLCMLMHFANNFLVNFVYYPTSDLWTYILFTIIPIIGLALMIISFKILNLRSRSKKYKEIIENNYVAEY